MRSSPVRTPDLQLAAEQPSKNVGSHQKDTQCPRAKEKPQEDGRRGKIMLESNPIPTRDTWRAQTKPCVHQDPETPTETEPDLPLSF